MYVTALQPYTVCSIAHMYVCMPLTFPCCTAPVPATASVPAATLAHSTATAGPSGPTVSYTHTSRPTAGPSGPTVSYTHTSRPTEKADMVGGAFTSIELHICSS